MCGEGGSMGMTNKFKIATWHSGSANAHVAKDATSSSLLRRRSKLELAGAFLLVTVLAAATSGVRMSEASGGNTGNSPTKPVNLQVSQTDTSTPPQLMLKILSAPIPT